MSFIAPNLSLIVGASTAAKLMGIAGGLTNLSKMPACNILLLGQQKRALSGFSAQQVLPHTGYIFHSDVVQNVPADLRKKVARIVAGKAAWQRALTAFTRAIMETKAPNFGVKSTVVLRSSKSRHRLS
jgi:U4/U6 small nuclear ribonucleoprotein PRP31